MKTVSRNTACPADKTEDYFGYCYQPVQRQDPYEDNFYFVIMRSKIIVHMLIIYNAAFIAIALMLC
jgi:hypothetical protein